MLLLSSIPPGWQVIVEQCDQNGVEYGHRLYVVLARGDCVEVGGGKLGPASGG